MMKYVTPIVIVLVGLMALVTLINLAWRAYSANKSAPASASVTKYVGWGL